MQLVVPSAVRKAVRAATITLVHNYYVCKMKSYH